MTCRLSVPYESGLVKFFSSFIAKFRSPKHVELDTEAEAAYVGFREGKVA
jgi:hypothetical protein